MRYVRADPAAHGCELLAVGVTRGTESVPAWLASLDGALGGALARALASGDVRGRKSDEVVLYGAAPGPARVLLLGVGEAEKVTRETVRRMAARAVRAAERLRLKGVAVVVDGLEGLADDARAQAAAEGAALAAWRFRELKTSGGASDTEPDAEPDDAEKEAPEVTEVDVLGSGDAATLESGTMTGAILARAENFARTLQARPGNVATPTHLAEEAVRVAGALNMRATVWDEARMREEGMHAILAVSRGSEEEARFIVLEHRGGEEGERPLVLVGKGLSFDAGGISLKVPEGMESMKFDMSGGAAVIAAMQAIAELGVRANVVGVVPSSENLPSGTALKPGDVIRTLGGKTVEVINTDAEGRLILADALAYAARLDPAAIVDCATLTGAAVIALGHHASAVLGNDDALVEEVIAAGEISGERCWRLPLWHEYRKQLESTTADLKNTGGRAGSTITAASFLSAFVGDAPWAHLDVAATAYGDGDLPYQRKGGYGVPTRLLVEWVRRRAH
ncbi:MAG TPA: leucyl aminopeptidase [Longimicrobiales bacterium]|nr:leucyl aminopeptidase [Longimicrobiales bacterium]